MQSVDLMKQGGMKLFISMVKYLGETEQAPSSESVPTNRVLYIGNGRTTKYRFKF